MINRMRTRAKSFIGTAATTTVAVSTTTSAAFAGKASRCFIPFWIIFASFYAGIRILRRRTRISRRSYCPGCQCDLTDHICQRFFTIFLFSFILCRKILSNSRIKRSSAALLFLLIKATANKAIQLLCYFYCLFLIIRPVGFPLCMLRILQRAQKRIQSISLNVHNSSERNDVANVAPIHDFHAGTSYKRNTVPQARGNQNLQTSGSQVIHIQLIPWTVFLICTEYLIILICMFFKFVLVLLHQLWKMFFANLNTFNSYNQPARKNSI